MSTGVTGKERTATTPIDVPALRRVFAITNEANRSSLHPDVVQALSEVADRAPIHLMAAVDYENRQGEYEGYAGFGNDVAKKTLGSHKVGVWAPQPRNTALDQFLQAYAHIRYKDAEALSRAEHSKGTESIRLGSRMADGTRTVYYMYAAPGYKASFARPNTVMGAGVQLSAAQAERLFLTLRSHPEDARAFFVGATNKCDRSDHIWGNDNKRPNWAETDGSRHLIFVEERGINQMDKPPLDISYVQRQRDGTWKETPVPEELQPFEIKAREALERRRKLDIEDSRKKDEKPAEKSGFLRRWFG